MAVKSVAWHETRHRQRIRHGIEKRRRRKMYNQPVPKHIQSFELPPTNDRSGPNAAVMAMMLAGAAILGFLFVFFPLGCQPPTGEVTYPRRALALSHAHRAPDSIWTTYQVVYGYQNASRVAAIRNGLTQRQNEAVRVYCTIHPTVTLEHKPETWAYDLAQQGSFTEALHVATYENLIRGVDWFLRDVESNALVKWEPWCALNLTDYCPPGVWGNTQGLTCLDWLCGPGLDIATGDIAGTAFDGYILEEGPERHLWNWQWAGCVMLGPHCVNKYGYMAAADSCRQRFLDDFVLAAGKRGMIMLTNGHWVHESCPSYDPPMWSAFSGCKFEKFGDWGGCPYDDLARWWEVYRNVEQEYGPIRGRKRYDALQGWDVSLCQIELEAGTAFDDGMRSLRLRAGLCLMGGAAFSVSYAHDHHGGEPAEGIPPELNIQLGRALGPYEETPDGLIYREFENVEEIERGRLAKVRRRVVVNITDRWIANMPPREARWEAMK